MSLFKKQFMRPDDGDDIEIAADGIVIEPPADAAEPAPEDAAEPAPEEAEEPAPEEAEEPAPEEAEEPVADEDEIVTEEEAIDISPEVAKTAVFPVVDKPPQINMNTQEIEITREIVLDDSMIKDAKKGKKRRKMDPAKKEMLLKTWSKISPAAAFICALLITFIVVRVGVKVVYNKLAQPVDPSDPTPVVVEIPKGSGASAIAKILYEAGGEGNPGLIKNKAVFKVYVDFMNKSSGLKAGTYILSRNMSISDIVNIICTGNPPRASVKFTISEGMTVEAIANKLVEKGILKSGDRFLELCKTGKAFTNSHWFVKQLVDEGRPDRVYMLEGYLFPDTYEVYEDATEEEVITKMLDRFNEIYSRKYIERAEELDLTMDQVVILASIIEKEAKPFDFNKVSAVFYSRTALDMPLYSDATLGYILKTNAMEFSPAELDTDSPYNTYKYKGLPAGPISNPGVAAIEAALYPNEQYIEEGYLFFCLMDPNTGALVFAKTAEEHAANVEKYRPLWGN